jgi:hypothetical protein
VPARASHLPNYQQRNVLSKLSSGRELTAAQLYPPEATVLIKMVAKGWIERVGQNSFRITALGKSALKAPLPDRQSTSTSFKSPTPEPE